MNNVKTYLFFLFTLIAVSLRSQNVINDVGSRWSIGLEKKLASKWNFNAKVQVRQAENFRLLNRAYLKLGLGYDINDFINIGVSANIMESRGGFKEMDEEFRYAAILSLKHSLTQRISLSNKTLYQITNNYLFNSDLLKTKSNTVVRDKITLKYKLNRRGEVYATDELLFQLLGKKEKYFGRNRIYAGYIYKLNSRLDLEPYFIVERTYNKKNGPQSRNFYYCLHLGINL